MNSREPEEVQDIDDHADALDRQDQAFYRREEQRELEIKIADRVGCEIDVRRIFRTD